MVMTMSSEQEHKHLEPVTEETIFALSRPDAKLLTLYFIYALCSTVLFPFAMIPLYFRYHTLRYTFDKEGVSIAYGILWRRESYLTYSRIQDIHITRNIFERWLGLGTVAIQTAAGSADSEEAIVGLREYEMVRNFLYSRMRGIANKTQNAPHTPQTPATNQELEVLLSIKNELQTLNTLLKGNKQ